MGVSSAELAIVLSAKDQASGTISKVGGKLKGLGGVGKIAKMGLMAAGVGAVVAGAALFKMGADFDKAYDTIIVGTGATGEALEGLKGDFKAVFKGVPTDMASASTAIADLNTGLGLTGEPLQTLSKQMLELSRITKTDVGSNIKSVTRLFGDWSVASDDQSAALDRVFKTSQATGPSVDRLSQLMVSFGAPLRALNFTFEESAALMGKWEKEGVNTELVMGSLKIAIAKFAKEGVPLRQGLDETIKKIQELGPGAEATSLAMEKFGARAGGDMAAAILEGKFAIEDLMGTLDEGGAGIMETGRQTMSLGEKFTMLKNTLMVAVEPAASAVFNGLFKLWNLIEAKVMPVVSKWVKQLRDELAPVFKADVLPVIRELASDVGPALSQFLRAALPHLQEFGEIFLSIGKVVLPMVVDAVKQYLKIWQAIYQNVLEPYVLPILKKIGTFLLEHKPILIAVAAAILLLMNPWLAVAAGIVLVLAKWDEIKAVFTEAIPDAINTALEWIKQIPIIGPIFEDAWNTVKVIVETYVAALLLIVKGLFDSIKNAFDFWKAIFSGDWGAAWTAVKDQFEVIVNLLSGLFGIALDAIKSLLLSKLAMLTGIGTDLGNLIVDAADAVFGGLWDKLSGAVSAAASWVAETGATVASAIGTSIGDAIMTGIETILDVSKLLNDLLLAGMGWLTEFGENLRLLGVKVGNLIWEGIKSAIGSLGDLLGDLVGSIPGLGGVLGEIGIDLQKGGFIPPGVVRPAVLHGGAYGEAVIPLGPESAPGGREAGVGGFADAIAAAVAQQLPRALESVTITLDGEVVGRLLSRRQGGGAFMLSRGG